MSIVKKIDFLLGEDLALEQTEFQKFFKKKLKAYGVSSPEDLKGAKKKKFFNEVDREWKGVKEGTLSEASAEAIMMKFGPYARAKKMGILSPKQSGPAGETKAYPGSSYAYYKPNKQDQKMVLKDKGAVKGYPGDHKVHYHPETQDTKIPGHKTDVKGFPGKKDVNYHPEKQDQKIAGNKGDVKGFPGTGKEHYHPEKQDQKIGTKDKGAVKSFPGTGKEHYHPEKEDDKIPGDKTDVKGYPGDHKARVDKTLLGFDRDKRSDMTDPKPMTEQSTEEVEPTQDQFGPRKYAKEKGLLGQDKKKNKTMEEVFKRPNTSIFEAYQRTILNPPTVSEEEWQEYEKVYGEPLDEKWKKKVKIEKTGEHAGKSVEQLKKEIKALVGKEPFDREKMGELLFALRSKTGWKKGEGAAGLSKEEK